MFVFCACCKEPNKTEPPSLNDTIKASKESPEGIESSPYSVFLRSPVNELEEALFANNQDSLVSHIIRSVFQDSKGNLWFGPNGESVAKYDGRTLKYYSKAEFFQGNNSVHDIGSNVHAIAEDKNGNIWFGTHHGVIKYDQKTFRSYTEKNELSNARIGRKSILVDKSGTIWVGTERCFSIYPVCR